MFMCHLILFCLLSFCLQQSKEQATNSSSLLTQQHEGAVILEIDQANKTVYDPHQASAQVVQRNLAQSLNRVVYTIVGNYTFTISQYVTLVYVELYGGGGGGFTNTNPLGGGGGGYVDAIIQVSPQETLNITVGAGGQGGIIPTIGTDTIVVSSTRTLTAGGGGVSTNYLVASVGGIAMGGDVNIPGSVGTFLSNTGIGGACSGRYGGAPNIVYYPSSIPSQYIGNPFGGGGGGNGAYGGNGGNGAVIIQW